MHLALKRIGWLFFLLLPGKGYCPLKSGQQASALRCL